MCESTQYCAHTAKLKSSENCNPKPDRYAIKSSDTTRLLVLSCSVLVKVVCECELCLAVVRYHFPTFKFGGWTNKTTQLVASDARV